MFGFLRRDHTLPPLHFHNTLSGELEEFSPLSPKEIKMYNCGPTVYDRVHIGNLRSYIFADTISRTLNFWNYQVKQVINITDVGHLVSDADEGEDKIEVSAKKAGRSAQEIAEEYAEAFFDDLDLLGIDRSKIQFPKATDYIGEQLALVESLLQKGYAYKIKDGIYFDTSCFEQYGKLGGINLKGLEAGARVEENPEKKNPYDFALWKFSGRKKRQQEWDSPWGKGFPGWHIECTAMIFKLLGKQIDIHTGGIDHIAIHHNNEIAQAESLTGKRYVKYWMHNEFITIEGKKISKSLGNTVYLSQLVDRGFSPKSLRYWFLTSHYRTPSNFTWDALEGANTARERLLRFFFEELKNAPKDGEPNGQFMNDFAAAMAHDLDTPKAIALVWDLVRNPSVSPEEKYASLLEADSVLGLGLADKREATKLAVLGENELPENIRTLVQERDSAREQKDFPKADELRDKLKELGYEVIDTENGAKITKI